MVLGVPRVVGLVAGTAGGRGIVCGERPALWKDRSLHVSRNVRARNPDRVLRLIDAGKPLIEVAARNHIISNGILLGQEVRQNLGLRRLARSVVESLQMQVDHHQVFPAFHRDARRQ